MAEANYVLRLITDDAIRAIPVIIIPTLTSHRMEAGEQDREQMESLLIN